MTLEQKNLALAVELEQAQKDIAELVGQRELLTAALAGVRGMAAIERDNGSRAWAGAITTIDLALSQAKHKGAA